MNILVKLMNIVSKNKDSSKTFPDSFKLLINTYTIKNSVRFYLFCIFYLRLKKNIEEHFFNKEEIEEIYISAKTYFNCEKSLKNSTLNFKLDSSSTDCNFPIGIPLLKIAPVPDV